MTFGTNTWIVPLTGTLHTTKRSVRSIFAMKLQKVTLTSDS
jgi:hypothetical protein